MSLTQHTHDSHLHPHNEAKAEKDRKLPNVKAIKHQRRREIQALLS